MNKITCICLGVRNMTQSIHFYRDKLGFNTDETSDNPPVIFLIPQEQSSSYFH